jgi:hypothetical protein
MPDRNPTLIMCYNTVHCIIMPIFNSLVIFGLIFLLNNKRNSITFPGYICYFFFENLTIFSNLTLSTHFFVVFYIMYYCD